METIKDFKNIEEFLTAAKNAGIKDSKLENAVEFYSLPKNGTFKQPILKQDENGIMSHIAIDTESGEIISMSGLQRFGFFGSLEDAKQNISLNSKGNYTLKNVSTCNPKLQGNQAKIAFDLKGKKFRTVEKVGYILPYKEDGYSNEEEAQNSLSPKTFYEVALL